MNYTLILSKWKSGKDKKVGWPKLTQEHFVINVATKKKNRREI